MSKYPSESCESKLHTHRVHVEKPLWTLCTSMHFVCCFHEARPSIWVLPHPREVRKRTLSSRLLWRRCSAAKRGGQSPRSAARSRSTQSRARCTMESTPPESDSTTGESGRHLRRHSFSSRFCVCRSLGSRLANRVCQGAPPRLRSARTGQARRGVALPRAGRRPPGGGAGRASPLAPAPPRGRARPARSCPGSPTARRQAGTCGAIRAKELPNNRNARRHRGRMGSRRNHLFAPVRRTCELVLEEAAAKRG